MRAGGGGGGMGGGFALALGLLAAGSPGITRRVHENDCGFAVGCRMAIPAEAAAKPGAAGAGKTQALDLPP